MQHRQENRKRFETFFPFLKRFEAKRGKHIEALRDLKAASYCVNTDIETVCLSDGDSLCVGAINFKYFTLLAMKDMSFVCGKKKKAYCFLVMR